MLLILYLILFSLNLIGTMHLNDLSLDEKIGQLFMVATNADNYQSDTYDLNPHTIETLITDYHIGGVVFLGMGTPDAQRTLTERLQSLSKWPLLIGQDCEWGLSMRLNTDVITYPKAMTLGALALEHEHLIYHLGKEIAAQCTMLGVHINFAPVADVNNNSHNPIINTRSFGDDPIRVARGASLYMRGMQDGGIIACAKHFPGHGDTTIDSHHALPTIPFDLNRLTSLELLPFAQLINNGVLSLMMGHLAVPALTNSSDIPVTFSSSAINFLRHTMNFHGLIITDGLGMQALAQYCSPGQCELAALQAGCDLLLCPRNVVHAITLIKNEIAKGTITEHDIDVHVQRIITLKNNVCRPLPIYDKSRLTSPAAYHLQKELYQAAITHVRGITTIQPQDMPIPLLMITNNTHEPFYDALNNNYAIEPNMLPLHATAEECHSMEQILAHHQHLIISLHLPSRSGMIELTHHENLSPSCPPYAQLINALAYKAILVIFGNPYNIPLFATCPNLLIAYENEPEAQRAAARVLGGAHIPTGIMPIKTS